MMFELLHSVCRTTKAGIDMPQKVGVHGHSAFVTAGHAAAANEIRTPPTHRACTSDCSSVHHARAETPSFIDNSTSFATGMDR